MNWIEVNQPLEDHEDKFVVGMQLKVLYKLNNNIYNVLVGNVNDLRGECDCCRMRTKDYTLISYRKLLGDEENDG